MAGLKFCSAARQRVVVAALLDPAVVGDGMHAPNLGSRVALAAVLKTLKNCYWKLTEWMRWLSSKLQDVMRLLRVRLDLSDRYAVMYHIHTFQLPLPAELSLSSRAALSV